MSDLPTWPAVCVFATEDGGSALVDLDVPVTHKVIAPDGTASWVGGGAATHWGIARHGSSANHDEWHTCGKAGLSITLQGSWEIEASDGSRRELHPGDLLIMLDTTGRGHRSGPLGEREVAVIGVGLGEDAEREVRARLAKRLAAGSS